MNFPASFTYFNSGTKILAEAGAIRGVVPEVAAAGCARILFLASPSVRKMVACQTLEAALGARIVLAHDAIPAHSSDGLVEVLARQAMALRIDGIVAFGGGSVSDTAKAVAICLAEGFPLARHASSFTPPDDFVSPVLAAPKLPIFAIPISASAAEVTPGLGIRSDRTGRKLLFWDVKLSPRAIFLDPEVNVEIPARILLETLMNALAHCVEGMYSRIRNPVSQGLALHGAQLIAGAMREIVADPAGIDARMKALIGAHISGTVIANSRVGIHHAICHCLGSVGGLSHGEANSIMLPHAMRFNADTVPGELAALALALAPDARLSRAEASPARAIAEVEALQAACGVPRRLRDTGLQRGRFPAIAAATLGDRGLYFNPRTVTSPEVIEALLDRAW